MNKSRLFTVPTFLRLSIALIFWVAVAAAQAAKPPPEPQDVNVINDTTNPVPVTVQNPSGERQFVGFSDTTHNGGAGWPAINAACASKFGQGARICTASEIYMNGGPAVPMAPDLVYGWVVPPDTDSTTFFYNGPPCDSFKRAESSQAISFFINSDTGELVIGSPSLPPEDRFSIIASCASSYPVTCCQR